MLLLLRPRKKKSLDKGYVISYLVNSCGLSPENVLLIKKLYFNGPQKPNVLKFLDKQGFSKTQIAELIRRQPSVLVSNPEKSFSPKIEFPLQFTGMSKEDVLKTISRHPYNILTRSLDRTLAPGFHYLQDIIGTIKAQKLLRRGSWAYYTDFENRLIPNVDFLRKVGVPQKCIELSLFHWPDVFWPEHAKFRELVEEVQQMGFDPLKSAFVLGLHARSGKGNMRLWNQCYETSRKWGWSEDDIRMAFKKHPSCMLLSEKKISTTIDM